MLKSFRVIFYVAKFGDKSAVDDGISIYTTAVNVIALMCLFRFKSAWEIIKKRYSHVEIWWPNDKGQYETEVQCKPGISGKVTYHGTMFTSTMRQDMSGTVMRPASEVLTHPERWDYMEIPRVDHLLWKAIEWATDQVKNNKGYNNKTIANFFNPLRPVQKPKEDEKNICSVAGQGFCWIAGIFKAWYIWSPIKFWYKLHKKGIKTYNLATHKRVA